MIDVACECGHTNSTPESSASGFWVCPQCGRSIQLACAESLPEDAGQGDFDASFTITDGPDRVGQKILLGGVAPIDVGKLEGRHIRLVGNRVSRAHCRLNRLDFGPSRWEVEDTGSKNGTFINGQKIARQELSPGDALQIGDFELQYSVATPADAPAIEPEMATATASPFTPPPPPPAPAARSTSPHARNQAAQRPANTATLAYQSARVETQGPRLLGDCDINWVMKLRNASTLMVYALIVGWVKWRVQFIPFAPQVLEMVQYAMGLAAVWLLTAAEPDAPWRWAPLRWLLRIAAVAACIGGLLSGIGAMVENESLAAIGLLLTTAELAQTALFLFYLNRLSVRLPNPGLGFLCLLLMIATPIFMGVGLYAAYQVMNGSADSAIGSGLLAIVGLLACRLGYVGSLIWFNKSFS